MKAKSPEPGSSDSFRAFLGDGLGVLGLVLTADQVSALDAYRRLLLRENLAQNLTRLVSDYEFAVKNVLDSLTCVLTGLFDEPGRVADIGSGAGLPGIPLKIARPALTVTLVDSSRKRAAFLGRAVATLGLDRVTVFSDRAEALGRLPEHRETYDLAVARAVAHLAVDLEYAVPLLRCGGRFVTLKGPRVAGELDAGLEAAKTLGATLERRVDLTLPLAGERRSLLVFRKASPTPATYPRRPGIPEKRPLGRRG